MGYCKPFKRSLYDAGVVWRSQNFGDNATIYGPHSGNDIAAPIGTPVHAAGDGYIEWAGEFDDTYLDNLLWLLKMGGNIGVLNCGADEPSFVYGHMDRFVVKRGDWVRKGQVIGYSGNTGSATTGAHLHVEAVPPGYSLNSPMLGRVNPDTYLTEWPEDTAGSITTQSTTTKTTEELIMSWNTKIQEYQKDGKTKAGIKTAAFILGNLNQWVGRILEGQVQIRKDIAALRKEVTGKEVAVDWARVEEAARVGTAEALEGSVVVTGDVTITEKAKA